MTINCMIVDDEPLALDVLQHYISKLPFLNLTGRFIEPLVAIQELNQRPVDLLFLDINMPDISGISLYRSLAVKPKLIMTTAYSNHAVDAFELKAVDYLLKPVPFERFLTSVNKAKDEMEIRGHRDIAHQEYFFIHAAHKIHKIFYRDILYLEGLKDYTKVHLSSQSAPLLILQNLKYFEDALPPADFIRIHRSYIVSLSKLNTITRKSVNIGNEHMPVSDNYREKFFELIHRSTYAQ